MTPQVGSLPLTGAACDLVQVVVRDIYKERDIGKFTGTYRDIVDAHGVLALKLTPVRCASSRLSQ